MTTIGDAMVTLLTDNWAGAGATPTFGHLVDQPKDLAETTEQVIVRLPIHEDVMPINDILSNFKYVIQIRVKSTVSDDRLKVLADETIRIINTYAITGITRQFAQRGEDTSDRKRQIFSRDIWASLEEHASTAGTAYSSPGAGDVPFPRDVSIARDLAVTRNATVGGTLGVTGDATVANLITAGNVDGVDISTHKASLADHTDLTATAAQIEDLLMFGSANAAWVPCPLDCWQPQAKWIADVFGDINNVDDTDGDVIYTLPKPCNKGGLKLYVAGTAVHLTDADANNFITTTVVYGLAAGSTKDVLDLDGTDKTTVARHEDTWTAVDCSSYEEIRVRLTSDVLNGSGLEIVAVAVKCYYAA